MPYFPAFGVVGLFFLLVLPTVAQPQDRPAQPSRGFGPPPGWWGNENDLGGSLVRTFVGLAIVIAVIWGLYWVLKQVKSSREEKASGTGLTALATLPLGAQRSLQLVRAGRELHLVGVSEHGVTPVRTYSEEEADAAGLLDIEPEDEDRQNGSSGAGVVASVIGELRRRTVRR